MAFKLFSFEKANKHKHKHTDKHKINVISEEEILQRKVEDTLAREEDSSQNTSFKKSSSNVYKNKAEDSDLNHESTGKLRTANVLLIDDDFQKSILVPSINKKSDLDILPDDRKPEPQIDPEVQDVIFKLYPEKYLNAINNGTIKVKIESSSWDVFFIDAGRLIIEKNKASIGLLQRVFNIGFNRAARIMDQLAEAGVVSEESSTRARQILMNMTEFENFVKNDFKYLAYKEKSTEHLSNEQYCDLWSHSYSYFSHETYIKAEEQLNKETESLLSEKEEIPKKNMFRSFTTIDNLKKRKNCIIANCKFSTPSSFVLSTIKKCSPARLHLVLIDDKRYFSQFSDFYLLYYNWSNNERLIKILNWCIEERDKRQKHTLDLGLQKYEPLINTNELPIMIVVRELYNVLQINGVREKLLQLLVNSYQFGIYFIGFSQYDYLNLGVNSFRNMTEFITEEEAFELFDGYKKNQRIDLFDQETNTQIGRSSGDMSNIDIMDGIGFEQYCASVLKANRFTNITVTKTSGDYGADIIAVRDQIKYAIQCKRSVTPIGNKAVQEVIASRSVYNCHVGVVLTNNFFTNNARVLASKNNILLWDRNDLLKMSSLNRTGV